MPNSIDEITRRALRVLSTLGVARARDLRAAGLTSWHLTRLLRAGVLQRVDRGLYRVPGVEITAQHALAIVGRKAPTSVVCLLSALRVHDLTTQATYQVWIAVHRTARPPKLSYPRLRIVRMTGDALTHGIERHDVEGVPVQVFSAAKTVADCFKFRGKLGLDVALEALRDYRRRFPGGMDELWRSARVCRVERVMRPYMEALA